ncbi:protein CPR-5-like [Bidens hawaiensis]|uniref:protein CPR-5-like n=1 Tax=Bidens hawaiensis TaxID=980011 RepID=UPI00404A73F3
MKVIRIAGDKDAGRIGIIFKIKASHCLGKGRLAFMAYVTKEPEPKKTKEVPIASEFKYVFPDELPGIPPDREVKFRIHLIPGIAPIAKSPYRLTSTEMKELKKQLDELLEKEFIRPSSSPWGASILADNDSGDINMNVDPNATVLMNHKTKKKQSNTEVLINPRQQSASSSSSSVSNSSLLLHSRATTTKGIRLRRRNPRVFYFNNSEADALALPLGMSIAAFLAQVLEKKDATGDKMSVDHLSEICTLAVKESLSDVFGGKYDCFVKNFKRSFQSTLMTLKVISEASENIERSYAHGENSSNNFHVNMKESTSTSNFQEQSTIDGLHDSKNSQQLTHVPPNHLQSGVNLNQSSMLTTFEKSVNEQARSNDLKALEISLSMQKMRLKEAQIKVDCDSNVLERFKLSMGISKANFKAEKFKTKLEDSRQGQLLKKCVDCLVAGLLIMLACLAYGTYIYSHQNIVEATESCMPIKESGSWWIPKPVSNFSSGFQIIRCQVQVISRMLFGILMIISITYLLIQRSGTTNQTMPVTFILLLLGVGCGFAGKFCIDTLGGSGTDWLIFWELLCLVHLFANICTSMLFSLLHGPITTVDQSMSRKLFPYWFRRVVFYTAVLACLPLLCGLIPFAGVSEWFDHFASLVTSRVIE